MEGAREAMVALKKVEHNLGNLVPRLIGMSPPGASSYVFDRKYERGMPIERRDRIVRMGVAILRWPGATRTQLAETFSLSERQAQEDLALLNDALEAGGIRIMIYRKTTALKVVRGSGYKMIETPVESDVRVQISYLDREGNRQTERWAD